MNSKEQCNSYVYKAIQNIIYELSNESDSSYVKAKLAILRNSIGGKTDAFVDVWPILIKYIPDEYIGKNAEFTDGEKAILHTMQLYSLVKQGNSENLKAVNREKPWENIGTSFSELRNQNGDADKVSIDKRFNIMATSETYDEFFYHLRQMIRLLKSKAKVQVGIDFPKLGHDLFMFLKGNEDEIRISWLRQYYRVKNINEENSKGDKNE